MTHADTGNYAAKHPGHTVPEQLRKEIAERSCKQQLSCRQAHQLADKLAIRPIDIGRALDLLEIRLVGCQLGLFDSSRDKPPVTPRPPSPELEQALRNALIEERLSCWSAWHLADRFEMGKKELTAVCEYLKIKIKPCQLGAF